MEQSSLAEVTATWGAEGGTWSVLVHGGAGDVRAAALPGHVEGCKRAAEAAARVLGAGGSGLDAAQRAVEVLESDARFNAGTGASLNEDGKLELDAAIMEGGALRAGAIAALPPFEHPIAIARAVLEDGKHVLYAGEGASRFARARGFTPSTDEAMTTDAARSQLAKVRAGSGASSWAGGTVGAVVRDPRGNIVAATSTGGTTNKRVGRVGDSPILGAGTYADDDAGGASNTGHGEAVLRLCLAKTAIDWMRGGVPPEEAARASIRLLAARVQGSGGIILVDKRGRVGLARNTRTMTWAAASEGWSAIAAGS